MSQKSNSEQPESTNESNDDFDSCDDSASKIKALLVLVENLLDHIKDKKPCIATLMLLLAGCGSNLTTEQSKALNISCDVMRDLKERGISSGLPFTETEAIRARVYSNAHKELSGQTGEAIKLTPPIPCVL
jgi:hypothetical protein